jgi:hypothetical protein
MVLSVHVETLIDVKKSSMLRTQASKNTTFSVDDLPNDSTLAAVTAAILLVIAGEGLTAEKIMFSQGADVYLYGYPINVKSTKYKDLMPMHNDTDFHGNMKAVAARTEPDEFQYLDLSCVTNLSDVAKAPVKWKGGAWLGRNDLIEACKERGIQLPVSSSDVCSLYIPVPSHRTARES